MTEKNIFEILSYKSKALQALVAAFLACEAVNVELTKAGLSTGVYMISDDIATMVSEHLKDCETEVFNAKIEITLKSSLVNCLRELAEFVKNNANCTITRGAMLQIITYISSFEDCILQNNYGT